MFSCFTGDKKDDAALMRNGALLLKKSIAFNNGRGNPIRGFSIEELKDATDNYARNDLIFPHGVYPFYNRFLQREDRRVLIKWFITSEEHVEESINEIVFASVMSTHKNSLKLLGCCLESKVPILVFEHANMKSTLDNCIRANLLSWEKKLKIAVDVANVIAYLHTAFPRPVVHRNVNPSNILIDEDHVPKLHDFSVSVAIPEGETHITQTPDGIVGTYGYVAPECVINGVCNQKADVYSFGMVLLQLFTAKEPFWKLNMEVDEIVDYMVHAVKKYGTDRTGDFVDPVIVEEGTWPDKEHQLRAFLKLAVQCISEDAEDRPEITEVGKQLMLMYQSFVSSD